MENYKIEIEEELSENDSESASSSGPNDDLFDCEEEELEIGSIKIKEIPIHDLYTFSEAPVIKFENYLAHEIDENIKEMDPLELFKFSLDEFISQIEKYSQSFALKRYGKIIKISKDDIYKYIFIYIFISIQFT